MMNESYRVQIPLGNDVIQGHLFLGNSRQPRPTVVVVPGWPGNPDDVLDLGENLSKRDINTLVFNPRGFHASSGTFTFANALQDVEAVLRWVRAEPQAQRFLTSELILGGYSFGGGLAALYAARDSSVHHLFSISGSDYGYLSRLYQSSPDVAAIIDEELASTKAPSGPVRFDLQASFTELANNQEGFGLPENADALADRHILLIGGWEDDSEPLEVSLLPFYRALRSNSAEQVSIRVFHTDHQYANVRIELAESILEWIHEHSSSA